MPAFEDTVEQTVEEVIRNIFEDDKTAGAILKYLGKFHSRGLEERIQIFSEALPKILGSGAVIVEDLILETLYSKYEQELEWKREYSFADYVLELKRRSEEVKALNEI